MQPEKEKGPPMDLEGLIVSVFASLIANVLTALATWLVRRIREWRMNRND